ncbi:MAG: acyl-CoA dehydrogenase family protein [Nitrososphaerales archaeon]
MTEEQKRILALAKEYREKVVETFVLKDEYSLTDPGQRFSWDSLREASRIGLRALAISTEYGGANADTVALCLACEEISYGDLGTAVVLAQVWKISRALERVATKQQREKFIGAFMKDPDMVLSIAGTEEVSGGSDVYIPFNHLDHGIKTTAVLSGSEWILNGKKVFISNASEAKLYLVLARTDTKKPPYEGASMFIVPRDTPGLSIGEIYDKIGERRANNAEIIFKDSRIPEENLLGKLNGAYDQVMPFFGESNALAGATPLGTARRAYDTALEYAKQRVVGGKPIFEHQAAGVEFAEMRMKLRAAWDLVLEAAWAFGNQKPYDPSLAWMAKVFASDVSFEICRRSLEFFGCRGTFRGSRSEKCLRDATMFLHSDNSALALKIKTWNYLRGMMYST